MAKQFDPNEDFDDALDPFADLEAEFQEADDIGDPFDDAPASAGKRRGRGQARTPIRTLEEFEAEVDANIKRLMSAKKVDSAERRRIAYWLGESGAPKAITSLALVYRKDNKNKQVQQAAAYALGQFKALDEAIEREPDEPVSEALGRPENAPLVELLTQVALYDQRGKRLRVRPRTLGLLIGVLTLTLAALIVVYLALPGQDRQDPPAIAELTARDPQESLDLARAGIDALRADEATLRAGFAGAAAGALPDCEQAFADPAVIRADAALAASYPTLNTALDQYNNAVESLGAARTLFSEICVRDQADATPQPAPTDLPDRLATATVALDAVSGALATLDGAMAAAQAEIDAAAAAEAATATAAAATAAVTPEPTIPPTDVLTPTPTPGLSTQQLNAQIAALTTARDEALSTRGHVALLRQYWTDIRDTGRNDTCRAVPPVIPENYALPAEVAPFAPQGLIDAVEQVNVGLQASRDGWGVLRSACDTGSPQGRVDFGLQYALLAETAFNTATALVEGLR